jgi:small neutral amino acid transporter SnatA (MarC family)
MSDINAAPQSVSAPAASGSKAPVIIIVVVVVICLLCLGCCALVYLVPGLLNSILGPAIGNVFSNIIDNI